jgi:hypothetical protein
MDAAIAGRRLRNQHIIQTGLRQPADVVGWFGAMQAQEYEVAKWAIGLRMLDGVIETAIERAFERGRILRTHVMRPTWHFVTPADIRWLLELTGPRVQRLMASYNRRLELDDRTLTRGLGVIARELRDGCYRTRAELAQALQRAGLLMTGQRLAHQMMHAELQGVICSGPRRGNKFTYALIAERAPDALRLSRDEALATLSRRYFKSHGPATLRDFAWWSGLTIADAKRGVEINKARREQVDSLTYWTIGRERRGTTRDDRAYLLPVYDEYLIAYRDRQAVPHGPPGIVVRPRDAVTYLHPLVIRGQLAGMWRIARRRDAVHIEIAALRPIAAVERRAVGRAVERYEQFLGIPVEWSMAK